MTRSATQLGRTLKLESLELRRLMAADIALVGGVLTVTGTSGNDAIEVREVGTWDATSLSVSIKNSTTGEVVLTRSVAKEAVQSLVLNGLAGNDTIVCATNKPAVINAGDGNDMIKVQSKYSHVDGGLGTDNLGGTAAVDCIYASLGVETVLGKAASTWGVLTQDAGGTSRYSEEVTVWVRDWNLDWVPGEDGPWGGDRHEKWEIREQWEILRWYSNPRDALFFLPSGTQKIASNAPNETGCDYENAWG